MKSFLFISILILTFCGGTFAQPDRISSCPTIDVTGPLGTTMPNDLVIFTANLGKEAENFNLQYKWTVLNEK